MAEKFSSQGTFSFTGNEPAGWSNSGLWSADQQQPAESRESQRWQKILRPNSPSDIELPPSPALSSLTQRDHDMLSIDLPGGVAANTGNSDDPASRLPESTAYPSPSSSIQSMKGEGDRTPAHDNLDAGTPGGSEKESEPSSAWMDKNERIITRPFEYLMAKPGKSFRRQLLSALNVWTDVDELSLGIINRVVEMLHNASLLYDPSLV
ncbi:MAG: hypothetical protein Q9192_007360, partial [Flavoplaca navasiana]